MKEMRVIVPEKQASLVHELFDHYHINYFSVNSSQETGEIMIISSIDDTSSNFIRGELKARGIGSTYGRIIISSATLEIDSNVEKKNIPSSRSGNLEEIVAGLRGGAEISVNFVALTFLAACLASFGLVYDDSKNVHQYLDEIKKISFKHPEHKTHILLYKLDKALILKTSDRLLDKMEAILILKQILQEGIIDNENKVAGYESGIRVYLNNIKPMKAAIDY